MMSMALRPRVSTTGQREPAPQMVGLDGMDLSFRTSRYHSASRSFGAANVSRSVSEANQQSKSYLQSSPSSQILLSSWPIHLGLRTPQACSTHLFTCQQIFSDPSSRLTEHSSCFVSLRKNVVVHSP